MSGLLWIEYEKAQEEIARLNGKVSAMTEKLHELEGAERRRCFYPQSEKGGRHVGRCEKCSRGGVVIVARGLCSSCYARFYRQRRRDRELGGIPVKLSHR